jgi:hypothetical protein
MQSSGMCPAFSDGTKKTIVGKAKPKMPAFKSAKSTAGAHSGRAVSSPLKGGAAPNHRRVGGKSPKGGK